MTWGTTSRNAAANAQATSPTGQAAQTIVEDETQPETIAPLTTASPLTAALVGDPSTSTTSTSTATTTTPSTSTWNWSWKTLTALALSLLTGMMLWHHYHLTHKK